METASSPGKWMASRHLGSLRRTRRTLVGILAVNFVTSSRMSTSWCLMRPCHSGSSISILTPPHSASAACRALCVSSFALLFWMKTVRSSGVGLQNCCEGVTHSACVLALTLAPRSIRACTARCFPAKAAKWRSVKPQTPPEQSSVQMSSSSCSAYAVTVFPSSPKQASTMRHQNVRDDGTDRKDSLWLSPPPASSANALRMKSLFWSYAVRRSGSESTS
mmetsp:Transcript_65529/g.192180  ORF Transcript_65529/g.192180 Transcript_65529/m.192180 type:complete len:220 (+) Transcript_65529:540-1199(+)